MSVRDLNKKIIVSSALNGEIIFQIDYDDFISSSGAENYLYFKISEMIENQEGCLIKIGYKSE